MEILGKILGSQARVKIMRLFLLNRGKVFNTKDIFNRSRVTQNAGRKELRLLSATGFIKRKGENWIFNSNFKYEEELASLLISGESVDEGGIMKLFNRLGKIKLVITSGIFIKNRDARVDLLVVGDKIKRRGADDAVRKLEAEIGSELTYAVFDTDEFNYRLGMYDKLIRDILDFPHHVVFQAKDLNLSPNSQ